MSNDDAETDRFERRLKLNGRTHAILGALVPTGALALGASGSDLVILSAISAGAALGPDIDHPHSTITHALPRSVHDLVTAATRAAHRITATRADEKTLKAQADAGRNTEQRMLTHTAMASVAVAGAVVVLGATGIGCALLVIAALYLCRTLVPRRARPFLHGASAAIAVYALQHPPNPTWIALAAAGGWLSHIVADACTTWGVPLLWPLTIRGKRWWRVRLLGSWMRYRTLREYAACAGVVAVMNIPYLLLAR